MMLPTGIPADFAFLRRLELALAQWCRLGPGHGGRRALVLSAADALEMVMTFCDGEDPAVCRRRVATSLRSKACAPF
eukprot:16446195-Heterocapsa_arctica.AAC.1